MLWVITLLGLSTVFLVNRTQVVSQAEMYHTECQKYPVYSSKEYERAFQIALDK